MKNKSHSIYLVTVERKEKFERVLIKNFDSRVEKRNCQKLSIGTETDRQDVVRHFQSARVDQRHSFPFLGQVYSDWDEIL
jgi:hypothetical protein